MTEIPTTPHASDRMAGAGAPAGFAFDVGDAPPRLRGGVVAIGNFDGVHRGHQHVLALARDRAREEGRPALALTFEPHPRTVFQPDAPVFRITPPAAKAAVMAAFGLDGLAVARFDRAFASQSPDDFIERILRESLGASVLVVGDDFRFGAGRKGDVAMLRAAGAGAGFTVTAVDLVVDDAGGQVSSTRVRSALEAGAVRAAADLLGYRPIAVAPVVHGEKRGREMNYPTANQSLGEACRLRHGIYAVRVNVDGAWFGGVASYGRRPTFDDGAPLLETFVFDFSGDLYGRDLQVTLVEWLRPEVRFDGMDALVAQMDADSAAARRILAETRPLTELDARLNFDVRPAG